MPSIRLPKHAFHPVIGLRRAIKHRPASAALLTQDRDMGTARCRDCGRLTHTRASL